MWSSVNPADVEISLLVATHRYQAFRSMAGMLDSVIAPTESLASIPEQFSPVEAPPLVCAGVTTFNALRNSGARAGDLVAILGIGGLGHLGVRFAAEDGF